MRRSPGAKLIVVRVTGSENPALLMAEVMRSIDSFTATSGKPTSTYLRSPRSPPLTSTVTPVASTPWRAAEVFTASMPFAE